MIDCIKVINLDRTPERLTQFLARNPGVPAERFPAVDGALADRADCLRDGILDTDNIYRAGAIGCAMSHIGLWRDCAAGDKAFHIVEDDAILRHDFLPAANAMLGGLDEWDIILWGHNLDWPLQIKAAAGLGVVVVQYDHETLAVEPFQKTTTPSMLMPLVSAAALCCYSVSPSGAKRILADCLPVGSARPRYLEKLESGWANTGIDVELSRHYARWRSYVAFPMIAVSENIHSASTIQGHLAAIHDSAITNRGSSGSGT